MIEILIVDDHPVITKGIKYMILEKETGINVDIVSSPLEIDKFLTKKSYDILITDLYMPEMNGIELTKKVHREYPQIKVIVYTAYDIYKHFKQIMDAGGAGLLNKTCSEEQLITTIKCVYRGEIILPLDLCRTLSEGNIPISESESLNVRNIELSDEEISILQDIGKGLTNENIAKKMFMSRRTIEYKLTKLFKRLNVTSRNEALNQAKIIGLIDEKSDLT
ncbi:response regulator transcription factor [Schinkia azotoformans]|uniref:Two component LuxR family transcriptional regulator n=1 Tax=Schinkia azotoformans LMG 9581 TaxID=1131731 RepID=K6DR00_SCHAZ|nr:response regulator transcription factor [Schinkia azotoformans]EKN70774.1 two component LuxR family transcriptional regulator [Schinkia azotoformans LMG 9581]MEC1641110.1 response regulator transcription factor [Schinkia azotoformans]MEC1947557.1 response regulator transcription factor [Schinkia azotoformans]